jgi:hypothetical protein
VIEVEKLRARVAELEGRLAAQNRARLHWTDPCTRAEHTVHGDAASVRRVLDLVLALASPPPEPDAHAATGLFDDVLLAWNRSHPDYRGHAATRSVTWHNYTREERDDFTRQFLSALLHDPRPLGDRP